MPKQDVITSDNVTISVDAILYYNIDQAEKSILNVEDADKVFTRSCGNYGCLPTSQAVKDLAKIKLRELLSQSEVNEILHQRERFSGEIVSRMQSIVADWGVKVQNVNLKDISFDTGTNPHFIFAIADFD